MSGSYSYVGADGLTYQVGQPKFVLLLLYRGDDSSLPVCSVSCTVHLQLFTNIDIL